MAQPPSPTPAHHCLFFLNLTSKNFNVVMILAASISTDDFPGLSSPSSLSPGFSTTLSFGSHVPISSNAWSKLRWLDSVLYVSAQLMPIGRPLPFFDLQHPPPGPPPPQHPPPPPPLESFMAARVRQKRPDCGSATHCAQVPGPPGPQRDFVTGLVGSFCLGRILTAPVEVTSIGAGMPSGSGGGESTWLSWEKMEGRVVDEVVVSTMEDAFGRVVSAQTQ